jgi:aspartyl-tRNA(Asn)/glutamyl-tRNA(Gln) amidotransferase subunit B
MAYTPTIGMEVHAELKTATKMFCNSKNDAHESRPNVNICPVCLAHPGTLPVINKEAVKHVLRVGVAIGSELADYTEFDRKNYFYPDLPKGYQISQYEFPLVSGGTLAGVKITRIHLEEDTASSVHDSKTGATLIDYNRGGMPLLELVTEPVIHSAEEAGKFGRELQLLLRYLGASDADMEQGQMRLEANISLSDTDTLGTKVEVKNINSFRAMEKAVAYEIKRQTELLSKGEKVIQETRGWDDAKQQTFSQRVKEVAADYRYFPDPDLPSLKLSEIPEFSRENLAKTLPELPDARRARYASWGIKPADAEQFVQYPRIGGFFDAVAATKAGDAAFAQRAANYIANDLVKIIRDSDSRDAELSAEIPISIENFAKIIDLVGAGRISSRVAKDLLVMVIAEKRNPEMIAEEHQLFQSSNAADLGPTIRQILSENASVVADYRAGKEAALQFLIGQAMRLLKGAANPAELRSQLIKEIGEAA